MARVAICSPVYGGMHPRTVLSLGRMLIGYEGESNLFVTSGSCLPQGRIKLVDEARVWGATHILWLDADMTFPASALERLLSHDKQVVGINYMGRRDHMPTAYLSKGDPFWMMEADTGVREVYHVATGLLLTDVQIFKQIEMPYFNFEPDPALPRFLGDDEVFSQKLRDADISLFCDADLSKECGHMGEVMFYPIEGKVAL